MATHICVLLKARFGQTAVDTWFLSEAREAAADVVWDPSSKQVKCNVRDARENVTAPIHGPEATPQSWELLDDFDDLDLDPDAEAPVVFELSHHFSFAPRVDLVSTQDTNSVKSFTTGATNATAAIAANTKAVLEQCQVSTSDGSVRSELTQHAGDDSAQDTPTHNLPQLSSASQQTTAGEGDDQALGSAPPGECASGAGATIPTPLAEPWPRSPWPRPQSLEPPSGSGGGCPTTGFFLATCPAPSLAIQFAGTCGGTH